MSQFYSTAKKVKSFTGVQPGDIGAADDAELTTWIEDRLIEIKDLIDQDRGRDYHAEGTVPPGIEHIALRMAGNLIGFAVMRRETPIVRIDDFTIRTVEDQVFTRAIAEDLSRYPRKVRIAPFRIEGKYGSG